MEDSLINFGGAVKCIKTEGNKVTVGGYLVTFGDATKTDLVGDWFTKDTYFGAHSGDGCDALFHHGLGLPVKSLDAAMAAKVSELADRVLPPIKTTKDEIGIFAEIVLDMADEYEAMLVESCKAEKMSWSSGAPSHAVRRKDNVKSGEITRWIIAEGSLTPTPCEPRHYGSVLPLKSYVAKVQEETEPGMKTVYLGTFLEWSLTASMLESLLFALKYHALCDVIDDVQDGEVDWATGRKTVEAAFDEFKALALKILDAIMSGESEQTPEMAAKFLKAKKSNDGAGLLAGFTNAELSKALLAGAKAYPERLNAIKATRESDGRAFPSAAKREEITGLVSAVESMVTELKALMSGAEKPAESETKTYVVPDEETLRLIESISPQYK